MAQRRLAGCVALIALAVLSLAVSPCRAGMVSLVFDDGLESVRQFAFPVLTRYGFPATTAVIASRVESGDPDFMTRKQLMELQDSGWEIASHSLTHKRPIDIPHLYADERCLTLRPVNGRPGLFEGKYRYDELAGLMEGDKVLRERADGKTVAQQPGTYYFDELISEVIVHPFAPGDGNLQKVRVVSYERELDASRQILTDMGFRVTTYVTPHNYWTPEMRELSRRYYKQVAGGGDNCNHQGSTDRFWLRRFVVHTNDSAEAIIKLVQDNAVKDNAWVIFCMHGVGSDLGWEPWASEKLDALASYLKKEHIPVVTVAQGAKRMFPDTVTAAN